MVVLSFKEGAPDGRLSTARGAQQKHRPANLKYLAELRNLETKRGIRLIAKFACCLFDLEKNVINECKIMYKTDWLK